MFGKVASTRIRLSALRSLASQARLMARLIRDASVPVWLKAAAFAPILYVVSPIDAVPDLIPLLGQLDDLALLLLASQSFISLCPRHVVDHHRGAILRGERWSPARSPANGTVIDAEWRRAD
jgi:uncharacterized membrane protein YkvA (DUF1232 family)